MCHKAVGLLPLPPVDVNEERRWELNKKEVDSTLEAYEVSEQEGLEILGCGETPSGLHHTKVFNG